MTLSVDTPEVPVTNLVGRNRAALASLFASLGEKPYRATQVMQWIYQHGVTDFDQMTNVSKALRTRLAEASEIRLPSEVMSKTSTDGTTKWVLRADNGNEIETVLIPEPGRNTLCISSQVGCVLDCSFCATGKQGFNGNLSSSEIVGQVLHADRHLRALGAARGVTNVVFMGMGEPLLNFAAVMEAVDVLKDDFAYGLSKRRVTVSTAGVVPGIVDMCGRTDVALALSLHAPNDVLRSELVPINRKYPLDEVLSACNRYLQTLSERSVVTIEYTLMDGVNDSVPHARELARLLRRIKCKVNLIPFNPFPASGYARPDADRVRAFQTVLMNAGYTTMLRTTRGDDIAAACGQLVGRVEDRTRRQAQYIARVAALGTTPSCGEVA